MPHTLSGITSAILWLVVTLCFLLIFMIQKGLKWHKWKKGEKIFESQAQMVNARWGRLCAWVVILIIVIFGWRLLLYPVLQFF